MNFIANINIGNPEINIDRGSITLNSFGYDYLDITLSAHGKAKSKSLDLAAVKALRDNLTDYLNKVNNVITLKPKRAKLPPQSQKVLDHLKSHGSLSAVEAAAIYKVRSLSRRINDIEETGVKIARTNKVDATGQRYTSYALAA